MKAMETLQDLIEEAKVRTVWWALCIFATAYILTHASKSMWLNLPISILFVSGLRILFSDVELHWKERNVRPLTYLSHLEKRQLSVNDSRLFTLPSPPRWKRKIYSPLVEAAMEDFINKLLQDFVVDLWSEITPDKDAPDLIHAIIMDVLGEISGRVREINLVDLLTRDIVNLIGDHLDLFRRNQAAIGVDVMKTLSSEERDERLKYYLISSKELHPALISPECEYKVLQHLMGGVLARVLRPRESQCPLVRCIARELLTSLVMQPLMNMASPGNINELIEYIFLAKKDEGVEEGYSNQSQNFGLQSLDHTVATDCALHGECTLNENASLPNQGSDMTLSRNANQGERLFYSHGCSVTNEIPDKPINLQPADWAQVLNVATSRRTEVLMPENLENMWTKGRHYKKKTQKTSRAAILAPVAKDSGTCAMPKMDLENEISIFRPDFSSRIEDKSLIHLPPRSHRDAQVRDRSKSGTHLSHEAIIETSPVEGHLVDKLEDSASLIVRENRARLKRSNSASDLIFHPKVEGSATSKSDAPIISEFYSANFSRHKEVHNVMSASDMVVHSDRLHNPKIKCRVLGAYFEKHGSKSFAVYSISVTDANKTTWFVKRRYSNFERLHRRLKEIPNYTLHLPPKRIFSSSTEDAFVHQRCIQLDKYLQDLLSIANVAEQHEVWDFLSSSSKNYFCGKSSSVMRTLAVNVDDAVDDIIRQFKGTSHGLVKKDGSPSLSHESVSSVSGRNLSWSLDDINKQVFQQNTAESTNSFSDNEEGDKDGNQGHEETNSSKKATGWHSDNELNFNRFPPRVVKCLEEVKNSHSEEKHISGLQPESLSLIGYPVAALPVTSGHIIDTTRVPLKWDPPKLSVPVLNLVDNIFQLKQRGWLRRQVLWISKQILQLMMEDAIDDWLLRQIQLLRKDDTIAQGIHWAQDALWPNGTFFLKLNNQSEVDDSSDHKSSQPSSHLEGSKFAKPGSFEQQLEAARRASDVKKMIFDGPPTTLVGLIGHKQYRRCARDIYFFLQSTTCLKQLAYGILELLLVSIFPELRDLVLDVHDKMHV